MSKLSFILIGIFWAIALGLIITSVYIRIFIIGDVFDPWRMYSTQMLWGAVIAILTSVLVARLSR